MQKQTATAFGAALLLSVACIWETVSLRGQSQKIAALERQLGEQSAALKTAQEKNRALEEHKKILDSESQQLRKKIAALKNEPAAPQAAAPGSAPGKSGGGFKNMLAKMMSDPAMRKAMAQQQRGFFQMSYAGLFKELGLTPEQKDKLLDLIMDRQMKVMEASAALFGEDEAQRKSAQQAITDTTKSSNDEIKSFLGDANFHKFEDWEKNAPTRMAMDQIKQQLAATATPLQDFQATQLSSIMQEENARKTGDATLDFSQAQKDPSFFASPENVDKMIAHIQDVNQRVLTRAQTVLNADQLEKLKSYQSSQLEMQKLGLKMAAQMFGGGDNGDASVNPAGMNVQIAPAPPAPAP